MEAVTPASEAATSQATAQPRKTKVTVEVERSACARLSSSEASGAACPAPVPSWSAWREAALAAGSSVRPISSRAKITSAPRAPGSNQPLIIATMKNASATREITNADRRSAVDMAGDLRPRTRRWPGGVA